MTKASRPLSKKEVESKLKALSSWELNKKGTELKRVFEFNTFLNGLAFVAKVAVLAEVLSHHPDIELTYGEVKITLTTHDVKGLTSLDFELARKIDEIKLQ